MTDDFAIATASPRPVRIGGADFLVGKFTPRDLGDLQAWLKSVSPDPRLKARELCAGLSDAVAIEIWRDLSADAKFWPPSIETREGNEILTMTGEGAARVLWVMLRRHNPGVDLDRARQLADCISTAELSEIMGMGFPEPNFDPKSPTTPMETEDRGPVMSP